MKIEKRAIFQKRYKKLHKNELKPVHNAIRTIALNPDMGTLKTGDLSGYRVYKFKINKQEALLAYTYDGDVITLYAIGPHENFYRDLKR